MVVVVCEFRTGHSGEEKWRCYEQRRRLRGGTTTIIGGRRGRCPAGEEGLGAAVVLTKKKKTMGEGEKGEKEGKNKRKK